MNPILSEYMTAEFFDEYQALREQLLEVVTDDDLRVSLGGTSVTHGALCREIGEIEHAYVDSFRVFRQDFTYPALRDSGARVGGEHVPGLPPRPGARTTRSTSPSGW